MFASLESWSMVSVQKQSMLERNLTISTGCGLAAGLVAALLPPFSPLLVAIFVVSTLLLVQSEDTAVPVPVVLRLLSIASLALLRLTIAHPALDDVMLVGSAVVLAWPMSWRSVLLTGAGVFLAGAAVELAMPSVLRWVPDGLLWLSPVVRGGALGLLVGLARGAPHARLERSALMVKLKAVAGESTSRAVAAYERYLAAVQKLPKSVAGRRLVTLGEQLATQWVSLEERRSALMLKLASVDRAGVETERNQLRTDAEKSTDAQTRDRLSRAEQQLSDMLEQLDGLQTQFERLQADCTCALAAIERAAMAAELTPASGEGIEQLATRLTSTRMAQA